MNRSIVLHNDTKELPRLMSFVERVCHDLDIGDVMPLQLALEEVVVNVMHYAYASGTTGDIWVSVEHKSDRVVFIVEDEGIAFNPTKAPDVDTSLSAEERSIGGLGIFIVRQTMDIVRYSRRGERNRLRLTKIINR
ncbi:MAG: ATP-binding protein [Alistipes sp.]|nr:ATP-binding protein [Alistipes sp.]